MYPQQVEKRSSMLARLDDFLNRFLNLPLYETRSASVACLLPGSTKFASSWMMCHAGIYSTHAVSDLVLDVIATIMAHRVCFTQPGGPGRGVSSIRKVRGRGTCSTCLHLVLLAV